MCPSGIVRTIDLTIVALATALAPVAGAASLNSPEAREAGGVLCGYVAARNGHDFAKARALAANDIRWLDTEGRNHPKNDARVKTMLSWEEVMGAAWGCRVLGFADGWLEAEISERNRMYDALGVGTILQRDRVRVAGGQIREGRTLAEWSTGREEDEAFAEFKDWLKELPGDRRAGVMRDGNLIFDAESARRTLPLLDLWEREHPPARRLLAAALEALGGEERVAALDDWIVEGRGRENLSAELQGLSPDEPTWRPHEEKVAIVRASGAVAWERKTPRNDQSLRWRRFIDKADASGVVDWTVGYGGVRPGGVPQATREALMRRVPHLLLLDVATRAKRLISRGERRLEGASHEIVEATLPDDTRLSLFLSRNPRSHVTQIRGFLTAFVEFEDFVAVFDAPASAVGLESIPAGGRADCEQPVEELRAAIARTCPGKPVRFVVVSHHHGDHLGGLRAFAGPGVTILAAPGHMSAVRRALTAPHVLAPDRWSGDGREVSVEAVPDRRIIGDGRRSLEVLSVGANPHTSDNLFAWLPDERVLLDGDLFYFEEGEPFPPSGRETMNRFFARWLETHGLSPRAVYGVHYAGAAGPQALARAAR